MLSKKKRLINIGLFLLAASLVSGLVFGILPKTITQGISNEQQQFDNNTPIRDPIFQRKNQYDQNNFPIIEYLRSSTNNNNGFYYLPDWSNQSIVYDFFAARVISLKITDSNTSSKTFGTGTIIAKASTDPNDHFYYVLTNAHVAEEFLKDNYTASFTVSPFLSNGLAAPSQSQLMNSFSFTDENDRFLSFKNPNKTTSVFWTPTNITVNDYEVRRNSNNQKIDKSTDQTGTEFINSDVEFNANTDQNQMKRIKAQFMADLSVLKLDFSNLFTDTNSSINNQNQKIWSTYQTLFENKVKNQDVSFTKTINSHGFIAGFPSSINNQKQGVNNWNLGWINLGIYHNNNSYQKAVFYNDVSFEDQGLGIKYNNEKYYVPIGSYVVAQMNLQAGASGSLFVHLNNNSVSLAGIYWGASEMDNKKHDKTSQEKDVIDWQGNISPFIIDGQYDLIGGFPQSSQGTPKTNNFCDFLQTKKKNDAKLRTPTFCLNK